MQRPLKISVLICCSVLTVSSYALDISQAYNLALRNSYQLKAGNAERLARHSAANTTHSVWFPQVSLTGFLNHGNYDINGANTGANFNGIDVVARQSIFNYAKIARAMGSRYVKSLADSDFKLNKSNLINKVVKDYFEVLLSKHLMDLARHNQKLIKMGLHQVKLANQLKLKTKDQVAFVESDYDDAIAETLKAQADYSSSIAQLDGLIGQHVNSLKTLRVDVITRMPAPPNLKVWQRRAARHNTALHALQLARLIAEKNVSASHGAFLPSLSAYASYNLVRNKGAIFDDGRVYGTTTGRDRIHGFAVGLSASLPLFSGGSSVSASDSAEYLLEKSQYALDQARVDVALKTRNDYLRLRTDYAKVEAEKKSVGAARLAVRLARKEAQLHTKTNFDVMKLETKMMVAHEKYLKAVFDYMQRYVALHNDAGELNHFVVYELNQYLSPKSVRITQKDRFPMVMR